MAEAKVESLGDPAKPWSVPEADLLRQATASLRGYVYQLHQSVAAWIDLPEGNTLHLEVAEDYAEILKRPGEIDDILRATQVKDTRESGRVTLNSSDVLEAIESVYRQGQANPGREVQVVFLTTSEIGKERKNPLPSGNHGLTAWKTAAEGGSAAEIRKALIARLPKGPTKTFVRRSNSATLWERLLSRLRFECGASDWELIVESNRVKLVAMSDEVRSTAAAAHGAYETVFAELLNTILTSSTRRLTRGQLVKCLERATAIALPSKDVERLVIAKASAQPDLPIDLLALQTIAAKLIDASEPPSIAALFADVPAEGQIAFDEIAALDLTLTRSGEPQKKAERVVIAELAGMAEKRHLVTGPPGSGKSRALWRSAGTLLSKGDVVPLFLSAAQLVTAGDLFAPLAHAAVNLSVDAILADPRVCILIDGWSEFAKGDKAGERQKVLGRLGGARVIATAKSTEAADGAFEAWALDLLSPQQVTASAAFAHPARPTLSPAVVDLLRLPLLLSIHLLTEADAFSPGDLLRKFHEQLALDLPERFTDVLAYAAAASVLADDRGYGRFSVQIETYAAVVGVSEPKHLLRRLGTIVERNGKALPIHDLYWNWLAGRGLLRYFSTSDALRSLATRECYDLALQSGEVPKPDDARSVAKDDIILAATLGASRSIGPIDPLIGAAIDQGFNDSRLARRSRAGLAALAIGKPEYLRRALDVLSETYKAGLALPEWSAALRPDVLYPQRSIIAGWISAAGSDLLLEAIAARGGPEWSGWLEQLAANGTLPNVEALAAALACRPDFPAWGRPHFEKLVATAPWLLRTAAERRANRALAWHVATTYDHLMGTVINPGSSGWLHLNRVLVNCGDDAVFEALLGQFSEMSKKAQEYLGFAVVDRGEPWIGAFQKIAFAAPGKHHHRLAEHLSSGVDDDTARAWIANGHTVIGWRVLVSRHGSALLPELISALPASFADLPDVPELDPFQFLKDAPASLIEILWSRVRGVMRPRTMDQLLEATAAIYPQGMVHIVGFVCSQPNALPSYHLSRTLKLYRDWRERIGTHLGVETSNSQRIEFSRWIAAYSAINRWDAHFSPQMLSTLPEVAVALVLDDFRQDDAKALAVLHALKDLKVFNQLLLDRMLSAPCLAAIVPDVFAKVFDAFPSPALTRCLEHPDIDQDQLIFRLGKTSNPLHREVHAALIRRVLSQPMDIHHYRYVAATTRAHTRFEVREMLSAIDDQDRDHVVWLTREIEIARNERLIDEEGLLLPN